MRRKASQIFRRGEFNYAEYRSKGDVTTIYIYKHGWKRKYYFKVKDLGKKSEKIIEDQDVLEK